MHSSRDSHSGEPRSPGSFSGGVQFAVTHGRTGRLYPPPPGDEMTVIKVTCPRCGDLDLMVWQLLGRRQETAAYYEFTCTSCEEDVLRPTDHVTIDRLAAAGVRVVADLGPLTPDFLAAATRYLKENDCLVADALTLDS